MMEKLDLKSLVKQYPGCMESRAKLRSTLTDCYPQPEYKRDINLALIVYENGLLTKLRAKDSLAPHEIAAVCAKIENEYGIPPELSVRAIIAWGEVWGTSGSASVVPKSQATQTANTSVTPVSVQLPAAEPFQAVRGSRSEYMIQERQEGWFITAYWGYGKKQWRFPPLLMAKGL